MDGEAVWPGDQVVESQGDVAGVDEGHARNRELNIISTLIIRRLRRIARQAKRQWRVCREKVATDGVQGARVKNDREAHLDKHHGDERAEKSDQKESGRDRRGNRRKRRNWG